MVNSIFVPAATPLSHESSGPRLLTPHCHFAVQFASNQVIGQPGLHGDVAATKGRLPSIGDGSEDGMAQVIEFYIPARFKPKVKWVPVEQRGKILEFPADMKKSA